MRLLRRREPRLDKLVPVPAMSDLPTAKLQSPARYLGTLDGQDTKVTGQTLSARSSARLHLSAEALDVVRMAGSFRIPVAALRGASRAEDFAGTGAEDVLVVRWQHGEQEWRTGFRMETGKNLTGGSRAPDLDQWVRTISKMTRATKGK